MTRMALCALTAIAVTLVLVNSAVLQTIIRRDPARGRAGRVNTGTTGGQVTTHARFTDGILRAGLNYQSH
jgi:hypothetical protein